ncbi:MAG: nucleotidyltransferase family protein [Eubacteriales bacterium]|nr:nucleotidyltransferase family protein [Eubacteriales bacterium]
MSGISSSSGLARIHAIVMAAGLSRRAGFQKLLAEVDGQAMYLYILDRLEALGFKSRVVVSNLVPLCEAARSRGFQVLANPDAERGKSTTIRRGLEAIAEHLDPGDGIAFFVCDQPYMSEETILRMAETFDLHPEAIVYPVYGVEARRGNPMVFPARLFDELMALEGDEGGIVLIPKHSHLEFEVADLREARDFDLASDFD